MTPGVKRTGRPKTADAPTSEGAILDAALRAFARNGYDGVSIRTLNRELGVSHNLIHQRFGSKEGLWKAAIDHGFRPFVDYATAGLDSAATDPLDQLNAAIRHFLLFAARHPEIYALMNIEAGLDMPRLDYLFDTYVEPGSAPLKKLIDHLVAKGRIRPISIRSLIFLVAHGAAAPYAFGPLAKRFGGPDPFDPAEVEAHAALIADILTAGLRL